MAKCPECGARLSITVDVKRGDQITCSACGRALGVLNARPLELEAVSAIKERDAFSDLDWDDDDEIEDEDQDVEDLTLDDEDWD